MAKILVTSMTERQNLKTARQISHQLHLGDEQREALVSLASLALARLAANKRLTEEAAGGATSVTEHVLPPL